MQYNILIIQEWKYFVAKNISLWITSQWESIEEAIANIKEATEFFLEDNEQNMYTRDFSPVFLSTITVNKNDKVSV